MKPISQMTREEKIAGDCRVQPLQVERSAVLRYLLAVRRNDTEQIAYFEEFWQECTTYTYSMYARMKEG